MSLVGVKGKSQSGLGLLLGIPSVFPGGANLEAADFDRGDDFSRTASRWFMFPEPKTYTLMLQSPRELYLKGPS